MKKIFFTLLALVGTMSMNAQVMKVMKNGQDTPVETYSGSDYYVVFEEAPAAPTTGTAKRTGDIEVNWIQLWKDGPKFAEYNVGATSATEHGGYYCWGGTYQNGDHIAWNDDHNTGTETLSGDNDTATKLWGSNWCMPKQEELGKATGGLLNECTCVWTNYNNTGVNGLLCTGKDDYASNSVFLPAAGFCYAGFGGQGSGCYWSSTPNGVNAYRLYFYSDNQDVVLGLRDYGYSVRAVLAEH